MVTATAVAEPVPTSQPGKVTARTLLVASLAGVAIGSANGSMVGPVLGPVVGAGFGLAVGAITGGVTAAMTALVVRRRPQPAARTARLLFLLPTICVAGLSVAVSGWLLAAGLRSGEEVAPVVAFGLTGPLALLLAMLAASWCLSPTMPQLNRPHAGRRLLLAAALVAALAVGMLAWGFFRV